MSGDGRRLGAPVLACRHAPQSQSAGHHVVGGWVGARVISRSGRSPHPTPHPAHLQALEWRQQCQRAGTQAAAALHVAAGQRQWQGARAGVCGRLAGRQAGTQGCGGRGAHPCPALPPGSCCPQPGPHTCMHACLRVPRLSHQPAHKPPRPTAAAVGQRPTYRRTPSPAQPCMHATMQPRNHGSHGGSQLRVHARVQASWPKPTHNHKKQETPPSPVFTCRSRRVRRGRPAASAASAASVTESPLGGPRLKLARQGNWDASACRPAAVAVWDGGRVGVGGGRGCDVDVCDELCVCACLCAQARAAF